VLQFVLKYKKTIVRIVLFVGCFYLVQSFLFSDLFLQLMFREKIWVHRVNSIEKLKEVENNFFGVELDVVFLDAENIFDVTHPPEPSIDLSLYQYMKSCESDELHFWIDFKNLNERNFEASIRQLDIICSQLSIDKERIIVESTMANLIGEFKERGYDISYYLPWPGLSHLTGDSLREELVHIGEKVERNGLSQISSNYHDYEIMKNQFPNKKKLLWLTGSNKTYTNSVKEWLYLYDILEDEKVQIILMKYDSDTGER